MSAHEPESTQGTAWRVLVVTVVAIAAATVAGLAWLWPGEEVGGSTLGGLAGPTEAATVVALELRPCPPPQQGACGTATAELGSGPEKGTDVELTLTGTLLDPDLSVGDSIRVARSEPAVAPASIDPQGGGPTYSFADFERRTPMLLLAAAFAALVIALGRLRGALSLLGLGASLAVVLVFIVPAILAGESPLAVSIVGALAVMLLTIGLAHGINAKSLSAVLGTTVSLLLVAVLASAFTELTQLTGFSSEEVAFLALEGIDVDFRGLLLAGMVIGALGVLDDVTVSQASTVLVLRRANPELRYGELYRRATEVGRDHVSATVNTLVLAYVGASLPILLIFSAGSAGFVDTLNLELVASEIVATLVGSIGLIAAVPVTTALTALVGRRLPAAAIGAGGHAR